MDKERSAQPADITGDRNQIFRGHSERLRDTYIHPWLAFERVNRDHFVDRQWLTAGVDVFLCDHDQGYFVMEAH